MPEYREDTVTSADGTAIGYRSIGVGPGLILVEGAMGTAINYDELARALAGTFCVYLPDRRGRGLSPLAYSEAHDVGRDLEDIGALIAQTGAPYIFGLSSGAIIALAAARAFPSIGKAAIYEPPFYPKGVSQRLIRRFKAEVERDDLATALVTVSRLVKLGPAIMRVIPTSIMRLGMRRVLDREAHSGSGRYAPLRALIPAMRYDFNVVSSFDRKAESFRTVEQNVLLVGGSRSPQYLKDALKNLAVILPHTRRVELEGLDHSGPWNTDRGGYPKILADELIDFFLEVRETRSH